VAIRRLQAAHHAHRIAHQFRARSADDSVVEGSIRQRSAGSFELRVFIGIDPETHRRRYRSMTVRANRAEAERELAAMVAAVRAEREVGVRSTVGELLGGLVRDRLHRVGADHHSSDPIGARSIPSPAPR
jgi:hypothetical protein